MKRIALVAALLLAGAAAAHADEEQYTNMLKQPRGNDALNVIAQGTTDTVVWNPGPGVATPGADLAPDAYKSFVCIEAAVASAPITLAPAQSWSGSQTLTAV